MCECNLIKKHTFKTCVTQKFIIQTICFYQFDVAVILKSGNKRECKSSNILMGAENKTFLLGLLKNFLESGNSMTPEIFSYAIGRNSLGVSQAFKGGRRMGTFAPRGCGLVIYTSFVCYFNGDISPTGAANYFSYHPSPYQCPCASYKLIDILNLQKSVYFYHCS